jgi:ammonia channel protein AmtB
LVFNLGGNLLAIPFFQQALGNGAVGSSIVTVLTEILMCIGAVILIPKHVVDTSVAWQALRLVFGGVLSAVAGLTVLTELTGSVHIVVALVAAASCGTIVYSVSALILRAVSVDDVRPLLAGLPSGAR